jgi:uncharacterized protein YndB with AHSA1/START domain
MTTTTARLRKTAKVNVAPAAAFQLFTAGMGSWWPLDTHSVALDRATSVDCEPHVGGQIIETMRDGDRAVWGTFLVWEPATRVRFTWHPGTPESEATEVEVRFHADGHGTLVELVHTGWDRRPDGDIARSNYDDGWDLVVGRYAAAGNRSPDR